MRRSSMSARRKLETGMKPRCIKAGRSRSSLRRVWVVIIAMRYGVLEGSCMMRGLDEQEDVHSGARLPRFSILIWFSGRTPIGFYG